MDDVGTAHTADPPRRRVHLDAEGRIRQLIWRHKAESKALMAQAEYMQRVATMLIPLVPKQIVARILRDAKGENQNAGSR